MKEKNKEFKAIPQWLIKGLSDGNRLPVFMLKGSLCGHVSLDRENERIVFIPLLEDDDD